MERSGLARATQDQCTLLFRDTKQLIHYISVAGIGLAQDAGRDRHARL